MPFGAKITFNINTNISQDNIANAKNNTGEKLKCQKTI